MLLKVRTLTNLVKVFPDSQLEQEISNVSLLKNETFSYQIALMSDENGRITFEIDSALKKFIKVRKVLLVHSTRLVIDDEDDDYIFFKDKKERDFPDLLEPIENEIDLKANEWTTLYLTIKCINESLKDSIITKFFDKNNYIGESILNVNIIDKEIDLDKILPNTIWLHYDAIANYYNLKPFSDKYRDYLDKVLLSHRAHGINVLYVPLFTPPLDTGVGLYRTPVQLVDVALKNNKFIFNFDKVFAFIERGKSFGYKIFEMSHLFSQWGAKFAPQIWVKVDGEDKRYFGWDDKSDEKYLTFILQFLEEFVKELKLRNFGSNSILFHLSDEPNEDSLELYGFLSKKIKPIISPYKIFDALSHYSFFERNIVDEPVVAIDCIKDYRDNNVNSFVYFCCVQRKNYIPNRFFNMPLNRLRVLGPLMYLDNSKGFLQWGYNFYNTQYSTRPIDPFKISDAGGNFPSGDAFVIYPGENGEPLDSIRNETYFDCLQDYALLKMLEEKKGRAFVVDLIHSSGIYDFSNYEKSDEVCFNLHRLIVDNL